MIFNEQVDTRIALEDKDVSFPVDNTSNQDLEDKVGDYKSIVNLNDSTDYVSIDEHKTPPTSQEKASPTFLKEGSVLRDRSKIKQPIRYEAHLSEMELQTFHEAVKLLNRFNMIVNLLAFLRIQILSCL